MEEISALHALLPSYSRTFTNNHYLQLQMNNYHTSSPFPMQCRLMGLNGTLLYIYSKNCELVGDTRMCSIVLNSPSVLLSSLLLLPPTCKIVFTLLTPPCRASSLVGRVLLLFVTGPAFTHSSRVAGDKYPSPGSTHRRLFCFSVYFTAAVLACYSRRPAVGTLDCFLLLGVFSSVSLSLSL